MIDSTEGTGSPVWKTLAKVGLTLGVSLLFAYLFIRDLDLEEVANSLADADYELVLPALLLFAASLYARALRWHVFYQPDSPDVGLLSQVLLMTYAGNNMLPLRGGEILRIQILLDRAGVSRMRSLGTALLERLFDLLVLGVFVIAGRFAVDVGLAFLTTGIIFAGGSTVGLVLAAIMVRRPALVTDLFSRKWPLIPERWLERLKGMAESAIVGFSTLLTWRRFGAAALLTAIAWFLEFGMYWLIAEAFSIDEGLLTIAFAGAAANLALSIPSAQGGVGPFQLVAKEALLKFGVSANAAGAYALALHVLLVAPVSIVGLLVFWATVPNKRFRLQRTLEE